MCRSPVLCSVPAHFRGSSVCTFTRQSSTSLSLSRLLPAALSSLEKSSQSPTFPFHNNTINNDPDCLACRIKGPAWRQR